MASLFDASAYDKPDVQHPGQLTFPDWLKHQNTVFHGSHRADWEQGYSAHVGTQASASDRLVQVAANTQPGREPTDMPEGGRIWARRLAEPVAMHTKSDSRANSAEWAIRRDPEKLYQSATLPGHPEEDSDEIKALGRHLREGRPISYENYAEDQGSTSVTAPRGTLRAWHQDVAEAHAQGLNVHPHDVTLAKQQFDPAIAVTPKSMSSAGERWALNDQSPPQQQSVLPYEVEGKYFGIHPDDPTKDNWASDLTYPKGAWERAQGHAEATGGKLRSTNPYPTTTFPEGISRVPRRRRS